ncbi:hypothetical protein CathTA2_2133 [Caldalkalibacillus thermarum TA2.A1]|uniref:Stage VI sporulation protein F n=2 Tax=Caldalkalibacillus thermarum (strain TA2.A1) TaxID=986075 RepID=F5L8H8_CALTT|nr:stage VI sporulation protein F [Caldalkalibacillus thermarum]EGL82317.1 hypothetical protein CathTA2_2133 [Caldalkalibacillus thermarum TA2.A1]
MNRKKQFFEQIEQQANVDMGEIIKLANSLQKANLKDEKTIRKLIAKISRMVNMPVSKEKEEFIVKAIMNDRLPNSLSGLLKMFNPPEK